MRLTNEQIEQILNDAPKSANHINDDLIYYSYKRRLKTRAVWEEFTSFNTSFIVNQTPCMFGMRSLDDLREILALRKEIEKQNEYIKQLEQDAERGESGVNGVV